MPIAKRTPRDAVEGWLATHAYFAGDRWFGGVRVARYVAPAGPEAAPVAVRGPFTDGSELLAAAYGPNDLAAGETLHVATAWREGKTERATLFLHLVDGGGKQAAGSDRPLAGGYHATDGASLETVG